MAFDPRAEAERELVDQFALVFEHAGMTPVAGRIIGRLLLCDPPHQSSTELADAINASRGSVSTTTRQLIQAGVLERVRFPGDRNAYFRIRDDCWHELLHLEVMRMRRLRELGDAGIQHLSDARPELRRRIQQFRDFNAFFEREFPRLVELWDTQNKEHR